MRTAAYLRIGAAVALCGVAGLYSVPLLSNAFPYEAMVNARRVEVRAPIEGTLADGPSHVGVPIPAGSRLALIEGQTKTSWNLNQMVIDQAADEAGLVALRRQRSALAARLEDMQARNRTALDAAQASMADKLAQAGSRVAALRGVLASHRERVDQQETLHAQGVATRNSVLDAKDRLDAVLGDYEVAVVEKERLESLLAAFSKGVYVDNGFLDLPATAQEANRLMDKLSEMDLSITALEETITARRAMMDAERRHVASEQDREIVARDELVPWALYSRPGLPVERNEILMAGFSCQDLAITAYLEEERLKDLEPGDVVVGYLDGVDPEREITGTVASIRVSQSNEVDSGYIVHSRVPETFSEVIITVDNAEQFNDPSRFCWVGAPVRLQFVKDRESSWVQSLLFALN